MTNPWDRLADVFAPSSPPHDLPADVADNVMLAWPPVLAFLEQHAPRAGTVLDFGCGGGWFAGELARRGYAVTGLDSSAAMIEGARKAYGATVRYLHGDLRCADGLGTYDVVTSIMTVQFLADASEALRVLCDRVRPEGVLALVVHNPDYVRAWLPAGTRYVGFDSADAPRHGRLDFGSYGSVALHVRTAEEYDTLARSNGMRPAVRESPPFTEDFLRRYPPESGAPTHVSEYLILGYIR